MTAYHPLHHTNGSTRALLRPTELEVLRILWARGPQTIRTIYDVIAAQRAADYLAVARTVAYLTRQGLLDRSTQDQWLGGNYKYVATISEHDCAIA
jgi:predicted transcriptional regulator